MNNVADAVYSITEVLRQNYKIIEATSDNLKRNIDTDFAALIQGLSPKF